MPRQRRSRIYWRAGRAWLDVRDIADVGGGREPLVPKGENYATTDPDLAATLASDRLTELRQRRRNRAYDGIERQAGLAWYAAHHLIEKKRSGRFTDGWLRMAEMHLKPSTIQA